MLRAEENFLLLLDKLESFRYNIPMSTTLSLKNKETRQDDIQAFVNTRMEILSEKARSQETVDWWKSILKTASTFYRYSFRNLLLIQAQKPNASYVAGAKDWMNKKGRIVKAGESAIWILAPLLFKEKDKTTGEEKSVMRGFRSVPVFDVSQTSPIEGKESFQDPNEKFRVSGDGDELLARLEAFVVSKGWTLTYCDTGSPRGVSTGGAIKVRESLNSAERAKVLAHEIAHELLHWKDGVLIQEHARSVKEVEAESVAYAVCGAFGIESDSEFYIAAWQNSDAVETAKTIKESSKRIFDATKEILSFSLETEN